MLYLVRESSGQLCKQSSALSSREKKLRCGLCLKHSSRRCFAVFLNPHGQRGDSTTLTCYLRALKRLCPFLRRFNFSQQYFQRFAPGGQYSSDIKRCSKVSWSDNRFLHFSSAVFCEPSFEIIEGSFEKVFGNCAST